MNLTLARHTYRPDCTLGFMYDESGNFVCHTLEEPWKGNKRKISCIPEGEYNCNPYSSAKFENVWQIMNVPGRDKILIHSGNTTDDIEGCVLVGLTQGKLKGKDAVLQSRDAMLKLRMLNVGKSFKLIIKKI